jgi:hypothetical protein
MSLGFNVTDHDKCIYYRCTANIVFFLAIHVDDILVVCNDIPTINEFIDAVKARFKIKDQGPIHGREFLGIEVDHDQPKGIVHLHCDRYLTTALARLEVSNLHPAPTPIRSIKEFDHQVPKSSETKHESLTSDKLRQIAGVLNYAVTVCRPDLSVAASVLSSTKWESITSYDQYVGHRSLRYITGQLKSQPKLGLRYNRAVFKSDKEALIPLCYADSDYAGDQVSLRSRSGHVIFLCNSPIYWSSRLQSTIALSSTAAEITSLSDLCRELVWISSMIKQLGFPHSLIPVYEDNRPAIAIIYRKDFSQRVRHMRIRDLWVRELCSTDLMRVFYVNTRDNLAGFFTKVIATVHFKKVILLISGYDDKLHVPADSCIATDYSSNDDETLNLITSSDEN